ncbi:MAG: glycerol-3-phosphate responsive antiterminator [Ktedonobacteraceae bacterium]
MQMQSSRSLVSLTKQCRVIPVVESRTQFVQVLENSHARAVLLRHCNVFDFATVLQNVYRRGYAVYVNIDHIDGIHADAAGLQYLAERLHITGIFSNHPKTLSLGKQCGLETIQRLFAVDSTGLESALESVDTHTIDLLDISPALVIPYITLHLKMVLPLPFIGSGLISTSEQVQAVLRAGAIGVAAIRPELWL